MPTIPSSAKVLKNVPSMGSFLISADLGFDECGLCGNSFDIGESSNSTLIKLPCINTHCGPCATMWRILRSPVCLGCYEGFACPQATGDRAQISSPLLDLDGDDILQQHSPLDSQIEPKISFRDMYDAFYGAGADSDDDDISNPGSPMREEDIEIAAVSEFSDEDLRETLILANNRVGTNFNIEEIKDEIPLAVLRTGIKTQLADTLTQLCIQKTSESDEDDTGDGNSRELDEEDSRDKTSHHDGETAQESSLRCTHCQKYFTSTAHLEQHLRDHDIERTCSICGRLFVNRSGRRRHENMHRETDSEREERLRKSKLKRDQLRAGLRKPQPHRRERIPQVL